MNSLNRYRPAKQFRCKPLVGNAPFGYEEIVHSADGSHNYQTPGDMVGAFSEMNERGRIEWNSLPGGTATTVELKFMSSAMTGKNDRSSTGAPVIRTTACNLLNGSGRNSEGWRDEH